MTSITSCQALQFALIPGFSDKFEKIAIDLGGDLTKSGLQLNPVSKARYMLLVGITVIALGAIGMFVTGYHAAFVSMTMGGALVTAGALNMLYVATAKIQKLWNSSIG